MLEQNLRRSLSISNGNFDILWSSTISQSLLILAVLVLILPPIIKRIRKRKQSAVSS